LYWFEFSDRGKMDLIRNETNNTKLFYILGVFLLILLLNSEGIADSQTDIININNKGEVEDLLATVDLLNYNPEVLETSVNFRLSYLSKLDLLFPVFGANVKLLDNYSIGAGFGIDDFNNHSIEYYLISANYKKVIKDSSNYNIVVSLNKRLINNVNFKNRVIALRVLIERNLNNIVVGAGAECGIENGRFVNDNIFYDLKGDEDIKFIPTLYINFGFLNLIGEYCRGHFGLGIDLSIEL